MQVSTAPASLGSLPAAIQSGTSMFAADQVPESAPVGTGTALPPPATAPAVAGPVASPGPVATGPASGSPFWDGLIGYTEGPLPMAWASLEILNWKLSGVTVPPLITTAPAGAAGTLDDAATRVLFGGREISRGSGDGYRFRAGMWFDTGTAGVDFGFFKLTGIGEAFAVSSTGDPGLYRPFFNTAINAEDAQLVAFIDPVLGPILSGRVGVTTDTELCGLDLNYRTGMMGGWGGRFDLIAGYRYLRLEDRLGIRSDLTVLGAAGAAPAGTAVFVGDRFDAKTQFHGAQVGVVGEWCIECMTFGVRATAAAGVNCQRVDVAGISGSIPPGGVLTAGPGGLFALPSNMGTHERNRLAWAGELTLSLGYQVTNNIRVFGAYNCLYWTHVLRAGEQINRFVNGTAIPDPTTGLAAPIGAPSPLFRFRDDSLFANGWSLGVEFRW
jgi:hypothetical protein